MTTTEDKELEEEIMMTGNALFSPPSSAPQLFHLLENLENCLMRVHQPPSDSMRRTLDHASKALATKELLNHLDEDVKVCVASCISEILRITAPNVPYEDEQLKEIFALIIAAFENISDDSSHLFCKRVTILETTATVRSWVLMVNLECYSLISVMFKHFLTNIREHHQDVVFSSMGMIMIMILDEIEEIPLEIVDLLLDCKRDENKDILPIGQKLGQRVIENCSSKLAPFMLEAKYCGEKRGRKKLQDSPHWKEKNDREEHDGDQVFEEEENRVEGEKGKEKGLEDKKHQNQDGTFQGEVMKDKRSRKRIKKNHKPVGKETSDREEDYKEQALEEENREEGKKAKWKHQEENVIFLGEVAEEKGKGKAVIEHQMGKRKLKFPGKQAMDTTCSVQKMHKFLSRLNGKKRRIIKNSIFSAFLDIPRKPIHRSSIAALIECYDDKMNALIIAGQPLKFCNKEIEKCIGLSFEGKRVDVNFEKSNIVPPISWRYCKMVKGNSRIKEKSKGACKEMDIRRRCSLKISDSLLLQKLNQMSVNGKSEAEDFLRLSILYMFNVYFFPSSSSYISWWPLKFLENLLDFGSYAWGWAVYDYLWMLLKKAAKQLAGQETFYVRLNGCVPLLQALACERISRLKVQAHITRQDNRSFDTIRNILAELQPDEIKKCKDCEIFSEEESKGAEMKRVKQ